MRKWLYNTQSGVVIVNYFNTSLSEANIIAMIIGIIIEKNCYNHKITDE